jgi:hypothetical protein
LDVLLMTTGFTENTPLAIRPDELLVALKLTLPVNPFNWVTVNVMPGALFPEAVVAVAVEGVREKSAADAEVTSITADPLDPAKVVSPEYAAVTV